MRLPLEPFYGTIGVAPAAFERRNVLVRAEFGGNMDRLVAFHSRGTVVP